MKAQTITIIGLDRMGASIGLALKQSTLDLTVIGHDRDDKLSKAAVEIKAVDQVKRNLGRAAAAADILVVAVPVSELETTLQVVGEMVQDHTLVVDLSGLKGPGLAWAQQYMKQGHYVGGSLVLAASALLDGRPDTNLADPALFKNGVFCLMPSVDLEPAAVDTAVNLGRLLGAVPYFVDSAEFDNLVQGTETLPGLMAAALFGTVQKSTGWRDMLRFADLPFALTTLPLTAAADVARLALNDKEATLHWLNTLMEEMKQVRQWVYEGEEELLTARLEALEQERYKWLLDRAKNDWIEDKGPDMDPISLTGQFFGGFLGGGRKKKE